MFENKNEQEARQEILTAVAEYCSRFHNQKKEFHPGDRISYASRVYDQDEMVNLVDSALEFWLTSGRYTAEFEKIFGEYLGVPFVSLVNSGSSANLLAFMALTSPLLKERQIRPGDEVITVACGFPTTVTPILQYGAVPVFLDVAIPQYNIDVSLLEEALSERTKAVMIAHTLGNPFDLCAVKAFCVEHNLWLVEDNCDALGSRYTFREDIVGPGNDCPGDCGTGVCVSNGNAAAGIRAGTYLTGTVGDIGTSSFYPPHHMTMGEGGAVYTRNPLLHRILRSMRDWGRDCRCPSGVDNLCGHRFDGQYGELPAGYDHKYVYSHFGYNLKATDLQAAIGCAQLKKFPSFVERRKENFAHLMSALQAIPGLEEKLILPEACPGSDPSWFGFLLTCREGTDRRKVVKYIEDHGVQTRMLFAGNLTKHPCFDQLRAETAAADNMSEQGAAVAGAEPASEKRARYRVVGDLSVTDRIMRDTFWVGVYPGMTEEKLNYMGRIIGESVTG